MFTFRLSLVSILSAVVLLSETKLRVEADECDSNSDCTGVHKYCCKKSNSNGVCRHNCIALSCATNGDCGGQNECCRSEICTTLGCGTPNECRSSKYDCPYGKYCCKKWHTYYQTSVCRSSCAGESCDFDSDCGGPNECCDRLSKYCTTCPNADVAKSLASWVIGVIVVSVLVALVVPVAIGVCCCCGAASASSRRPAQRGAVLSQQTTAAASTVDVPLHSFENNPAAQFQSPSLPPPYSVEKGGGNAKFQPLTAASLVHSSQGVQNYPAQFQGPDSFPPPYSTVTDEGWQDEYLQQPSPASTVDDAPRRFPSPSPPPYPLIDQAQDQFQPQETAVGRPDYKY